MGETTTLVMNSSTLSPEGIGMEFQEGKLQYTPPITTRTNAATPAATARFRTRRLEPLGVSAGRSGCWDCVRMVSLPSRIKAEWTRTVSGVIRSVSSSGSGFARRSNSSISCSFINSALSRRSPSQTSCLVYVHSGAVLVAFVAVLDEPVHQRRSSSSR